MKNRHVPALLAGAAATLLAACGGNTSQAPAAAPPALHAQATAVPGNTIVVPGLYMNYTATASGDNYVLTDTTGREAARTVPKTARLRFADMTVSFDIDGAPGKLARLYQAAFGRKPDAGGLGFWLDGMDHGVTLNSIAAQFITSTEFRRVFGQDLTDAALVDTFYRNVLHRAGDAEGTAFWINGLKSGTPRGNVLVDFTESPENKGLVNPTLQSAGIQYFEPGVTYVGAGAAAKVASVASNPPSASLGGTISGQGVTVLDGAGKPLANVKVDFTVAANNGTLAATSAITNAAGIADLPNWTLGAMPGTQTVTATIAGGVTTTVSATAKVPSGCVTTPAALGFTYQGSWTAGDCSDSKGLHYDSYALKVDKQTEFKVTLTGHQGRMFALIDAASGRVLSDMPADPFAPAANGSIEFRFALPAGDYRLRPYTADAATLGDYTLKLSPEFTQAIADPIYCAPVIFTTFGVSLSQSLSKTTSCSFLGDIEDRYIVLLRTGDQIVLEAESATVPLYLILRDDRAITAPMLATQRLTAPGKARVTHTATFTGFHEIIVTSDSFLSTGAYTLKVSKP